MKNALSSLIALVGVLGTTTAMADNWDCTTNGDWDGDSSCYITQVRWYPGTVTQVEAKLHDPNNLTTCEVVRVALQTGTHGPHDTETVRGAESILLTALTTGLPIKFFKLTAYGTSTTCYAGAVMVSKPGD